MFPARPIRVILLNLHTPVKAKSFALVYVQVHFDFSLPHL